ncbi:Transposase and inactivated derivatives [Bathymodiolus brooksi thiotrophic gill symbiont]|jgi:REP element-mobilizing transposase RayT|nr:Transposase and inactivated derivatives [Bathymodiolus brooksi thiotrophic gill symbiont]
MSKYIHKSHNVTVLIYHLVFPAKYRRTVIDENVDVVLKEVCLDIEKRDEVKFLEIGTDKDHVHFLVQSVPTYRVTKRVTMIKSLTAREVFKRCPQVKSKLWGGEFWSDGYFASTVGKHGNEDMIGKYVKNQGQQYEKLHEAHQLSLF